MTIRFNTEFNDRIIICEFSSSLEGSRWVKTLENHPLISLKGETFYDLIVEDLYIEVIVPSVPLLREVSKVIFYIPYLFLRFLNNKETVTTFLLV